MIIGVDIGGTKTLVASLMGKTSSAESFHFATPEDSQDAIELIAEHIQRLKDWQQATCIVVGAPGVIDPASRKLQVCSNLPWTHLDITGKLNSLLNIPVLIENDANLAGISEARQQKLDGLTLYLTISTGIGSAILENGSLVEPLAQSEAGNMMLKVADEYVMWEKFASGHALYDLYHKKAEAIHDDAIWYRVSESLVPGILTLLATLQPEAIIIGGSIGTYFERYERHLTDLLREANQSALVRIPKILPALHAEKAVLYGCYEYGKDQLA